MSRKKRELLNAPPDAGRKNPKPSRSETKNKEKSVWKTMSGFEKIGVLGLGLMLVVGVMAGGLGDSILKTFTGDEKTLGSRHTSGSENSSLLSRLNPFAAAPSPTPTPQLSKEYVYAGGRMLAVEDANATAAPPADLAVWRPSSGTWWVMGGPGSSQTTQQYGSDGDKPSLGDYDGDGKTDFCVYRPSTNYWYFMYSADNSTGSFPFGSSGDIPASGDFDGDGRTDVALYRPSNGTWYIQESSTSNTIQQQLGLSTDIPTPKDFDGDGKDDIAVWRDSNTTFYSLNSASQSVASTQYGSSGDKPVPADYDGDGLADIALFRSSNATWYVFQSSTASTVSYQFGISTDTPVQNDYDGDGKVDVAVWRGVASSGGGDVGKWFIYQSATATTRVETWGVALDIPVPAYYRR
jgi:hypothetical protein